MKDLIIAIRLFVTLTILSGILYPLAVTGICQSTFKDQANGSLIVRDSKVVGSRLIGQQFSDPKYLWGRPSATSPVPYNASASSGSNFGPTNPDFIKAIHDRVKTVKDADPTNDRPVPTELVTASASGLDPHISVEAALYQANRIAKARGVNIADITTIMNAHIESQSMGILGEPRINVLLFNLDLDDNQNSAKR